MPCTVGQSQLKQNAAVNIRATTPGQLAYCHFASIAE